MRRIVLITAFAPIAALDNGLGLTPASAHRSSRPHTTTTEPRRVAAARPRSQASSPPLTAPLPPARSRARAAVGFNTWNVFRCGGLTAAAMVDAADRLNELGLASLGYTYLNIDDCWATALTADGLLVADPKGFPDGVRAVADAVHARGLKLGIYSCRGWLTCAGRPASGGREAQHARQFAEWGVDYLKYDSCYGLASAAFERYGAMRDALNSTGRPILFSLCGWNAWYAPRGASLGNSWRIAPDTDEWANVYVAARTNEALGAHAGPGGFNDPDMLVGSSASAPVRFTPAQVQTQFSLWCVMAAPLLIGSPLDGMPPTDLATYSNQELIAVDQDALGVQGVVVASTCPDFAPYDNWWMSPWSMPHDVAVMWTKGLVALLCVLAAAAAAARGGRGCKRVGVGTGAWRVVW